MGPPKKQGGLLGALRALDAFPKVNDDFFQRTMSGGVITIVAYSFMLLLFLSETRLYLGSHRTHELVVDSSRGETISIDVDITFYRMPCAWLSLDAMDVSGEMHLDVEHDVYKQRLSSAGIPIAQAERHIVQAPSPSPTPAVANASGPAGNSTKECGPCYGADDAEHPCCNTCDDVRVAYQRRGWVMLKLSDVTQCAHDGYLEELRAQEGEGCRMWGRLDVNKVAGNFHFAAGRAYQQGSVHIHDMAPFEGKPLDFTHAITRLRFGTHYPGMVNPLEGSVSAIPPDDAGADAAAVAAHHQAHQGPGSSVEEKLGGEGKVTQTGGGPGGGVRKTGMYQYFLKVVPTVYTDTHNATLTSNQYSVTEHFRESNAHGGGAASATRTLPGVFFFYDLSPIKVRIVETRASFFHYLTNLCAIVGGVFAVSGLFDSVTHVAVTNAKRALGKMA